MKSLLHPCRCNTCKNINCDIYLELPIPEATQAYKVFTAWKGCASHSNFKAEPVNDFFQYGNCPLNVMNKIIPLFEDDLLQSLEVIRQMEGDDNDNVPFNEILKTVEQKLKSLQEQVIKNE